MRRSSANREGLAIGSVRNAAGSGWRQAPLIARSAARRLQRRGSLPCRQHRLAPSVQADANSKRPASTSRGDRARISRETATAGGIEMDDNLLVAHKWVRILADNSADGVWDIEGCGCCADDLPIPAALIDRIRAWQAWYDRDENGWGLFKGDVDAFAAEGLAVARAVKAALPDWTVVYFDEAARVGAAEGAAREVFEYEVWGES